MNVLAALVCWAAPFTYRSYNLLSFLCGTLPPGNGTRRVVVLDNASLHRNRAIREVQSEQEELGIELWYLSPTPPN